MTKKPLPRHRTERARAVDPVLADVSRLDSVERDAEGLHSSLAQDRAVIVRMEARLQDLENRIGALSDSIAGATLRRERIDKMEARLQDVENRMGAVERDTSSLADLQIVLSDWIDKGGDVDALGARFAEWLATDRQKTEQSSESMMRAGDPAQIRRVIEKLMEGVDLLKHFSKE